MALTDEQILDAYFAGGSEQKAADKLSVTRITINMRLQRMRNAGVQQIPRFNSKGRKTRFTPERVKYLNEYIRQKTEAANVREV